MTRPFFVFLSVLLFHSVVAQDRGVSEDSLRTYDLAEIVITVNETQTISPSTLQKISIAEIARMDAGTVSEVARLIPATHVQTNSRGESLIYLRNAGERQVALFFNGALLNVPWDNRVDMSLIPAGVVGGMSVAKGVPSVLFGANVLGGAINMTSRTLDHAGVYTEATGQIGVPQASQFALTHIRRKARRSFTGSIGYLNRTGDALASGVFLPFNQNETHLRTNTDRRLLSIFAQGGYDFQDGSRVGVAVLVLDGEKGVAPEGHLDSNVSRVRYWRYPTWANTMIIVNGEKHLQTANMTLRGAVWGTRFGQTIQQYSGASFDYVTEQEKGTDYVLGSRLTLSKKLERGNLVFALNALAARHDQEDTEYPVADGLLKNRPKSALSNLSLSFGQYLFSTGAEYQWAGWERSTMLFGASIDGMFMPMTGDKAERDPFFDYTVTTGYTFKMTPTWSLNAAAGRKVRFPTMRELFGEALHRFQVNPDLVPESSLVSEIGISHSSNTIRAGAVVFVNRTFDTIDQRMLSDGRRQRINLDGSRVFGIELQGSAHLTAPLSIDGHLTWTDATGFVSGEKRQLSEKPVWLGTLTAMHSFSEGITLMIQSVYTGEAFSMDYDGVFKRLSPSVTINARAALRSSSVFDTLTFCELYLRVNNLTDTVVMPQLGLPAPGREIQFGVTLVP